MYSDKCKTCVVVGCVEDCEIRKKYMLNLRIDAQKARATTTWLGNYCPYTCQHCGKHTDSKTPYCAWCGRRAMNYEDRVD